MTRVWVTGASGFIGRHLARRLINDGVQVAALGGRTTGVPVGCLAAVGGRIDPAKIARLAQSTGHPDLIFHLAGGSSVGASLEDPYEDFDRTLGSTVALLDWIRREAPAARLVFASSAAVYGAGHDFPIPGDAPLRPFSPYGHHKAAAELMCHAYAQSFGVRVAIVRLFSVYGPGLRKQLLWDLCGKLTEAGQTILGGTGEELRDWTHVDDVARLLAICAPLARTAVPVVNAGTGRGTSVATVARLVTRALDLPAQAIDFSGIRRPGDPVRLVAAPSGLPPGFTWSVSLDRGVTDYVRWFRDGGA